MKIKWLPFCIAFIIFKKGQFEGEKKYHEIYLALSTRILRVLQLAMEAAAAIPSSVCTARRGVAQVAEDGTAGNRRILGGVFDLRHQLPCLERVFALDLKSGFGYRESS